MNAPIPDDAAEGHYRIRKTLRATPGIGQATNKFLPVEATVEFDVRA
jgi:hypothetical protein